MPEFPSYEDWINSNYSLLLNNLYSNQQITFLDELIQKLQPAQNSKIIDIGCGTGEIARVLAQKGFEVTGVDYSQSAIETAKEQEQENLQFYQHDLRLPFWINYFDAALILFNSFGYYKTLREHDNAIRAISQSLKTDGLIVMDYLNVHFEEDNIVPEEGLLLNGVTFKLTRWQTDETLFKRILVKEEEEAFKELYTEQYLKLSIGDFTDMFAYQGLQILEVFGDYNFADYDIRKSPRLIFIAKKMRR